jgi:hypothetical protein
MNDAFPLQEEAFWSNFYCGRPIAILNHKGRWLIYLDHFLQHNIEFAAAQDARAWLMARIDRSVSHCVQRRHEQEHKWADRGRNLHPCRARHFNPAPTLAAGKHSVSRACRRTHGKWRCHTPAIASRHWHIGRLQRRA